MRKAVNNPKFGSKLPALTNKLIIENGGTKSVWTLLSDSVTTATLLQEGMHPLLSEAAALTAWCRNFAEKHPQAVDELFFYSTGTTVPTVNQRLQDIFGTAFGLSSKNINIASDVLASARATCQREAGISCILGTGSNACLYDGTNISQQAGGLGYILGDEGSGAHLGKSLLMAFLRQEMPEAIREELKAKKEVDAANIIQSTYKQPFANKYFASFAPYIIERQEQPFFRKLIRDSVNAFLDFTVFRFPGHDTLPVHFTGSVAWYLRTLIEEICEDRKLKVGTFQQDSVSGLLRFHQQ